MRVSWTSCWLAAEFSLDLDLDEGVVEDGLAVLLAAVHFFGVHWHVTGGPLGLDAHVEGVEVHVAHHEAQSLLVVRVWRWLVLEGHYSQVGYEDLKHNGSC